MTRRVEPWLVGLALALIVGLQIGTLAKPLGEIGTTRAADWLDLLTPWVILGCAAMVLVAAAAGALTWWAFGGGGLLLVQGHGIHLAANSIANASGGETAYLWDEVVGHYLLYSGLAVVLAAVFTALRDVRVGPLGWVLAVLVGVTLFDVFVEGATVTLGFTVCGGFLLAGCRRRAEPAGRLTFVVFTVTAVLLVAWGAYWRGWPEFSHLGWI